MAPYIPTAEVGMKLALTGTVIITVKVSVKNEQDTFLHCF